MEFKLGELFCGPGGIALGAEYSSQKHKNNKITHAWASDIDHDTCSTYSYNLRGGDKTSVIESDIRQIEINQLPEIDALAFGFPCNDFSLAGEQKGFLGEYGPLYTYGVEVLKSHQPVWFIAENVGGLSSAHEGEAFLKIIEDMESAGYNVTPHLYKFEEYGIPQARHRIIIVGIRKDIGLNFKVPKPDYLYKTAREALEDPPIGDDAYNHEFTKHSQRVIELLNHIPPGKNAWYEQIPENLKLNVKKARMSQIYRRLHPDMPSYTVTGSGGGGTHMYHYEKSRALTNREKARLQTFPDDFKFIGKKDSVRKQIGMAVPPMGAEIIFNAILDTFAGIDYNSITPRWKA